MAFTYDPIADRIKDDVGSFQFINRLLNNLKYLKQQTEVLVAEGATVMLDDKVKPKNLHADNEPERGTIGIADSTTPNLFHHSLPHKDQVMRFTLGIE